MLQQKTVNHPHAVLQQKTQRELFSTERIEEKEKKREKKSDENERKEKNKGYIVGGEMFFLIRYKIDTKCTVAFHL